MMNNLDISKAQNTVPKVTRQMTKQFMRYFKTKYRQDFPNLLKPTGHVMHQPLDHRSRFFLASYFSNNILLNSSIFHMFTPE